MPEYIDSSVEDKTQYIRYWLETNIVQGIKGFRAQSGYFRYAGIESFAPILKGIARTRHPVKLVVGSNDADLPMEDLKSAFDIIKGCSRCRLTVVRFNNANFHPKCYHILRGDGSQSALVGSGNLTVKGTCLGAEAAIVLDTAKGDTQDLLQKIANSIDEWSSRDGGSGAYQISALSDIRNLRKRGIIGIAAEKTKLEKLKASQLVKKKITLKGRRWLWGRISSGAAKRLVGVKRKRARPKIHVELGTVVQQWYKKMPSSDAQDVLSGTKVTGKLRLGKAHQDIDPKVWFRENFFGECNWIEDIRQEKSYSVANILFNVRIMGKDYGNITLKVDHALHRIAGQNNIPTILAWGPELMKVLRRKRFTDKYVVLQKYASGDYSLEIVDHLPSSIAAE